MAITEGTILRVAASLLFPDSVIMQNVFHLVLTQVVGDNDAEDVLEDLVEYIEAVYAELATIIDGNINPSQVQVYEYDSIDDDFDEVGSDVWTFTNTASGDQMPHGVAAVTIFQTTDPDVQGRKFWGGALASFSNEGYWDSAVVTAMGLAAAEIVSQFTATVTSNVYTPGVWSPTETNFFAYSGSYMVSGTPGYQRRRKPGVGI